MTRLPGTFLSIDAPPSESSSCLTAASLRSRQVRIQLQALCFYFYHQACPELPVDLTSLPSGLGQCCQSGHIHGEGGGEQGETRAGSGGPKGVRGGVPSGRERFPTCVPECAHMTYELPASEPFERSFRVTSNFRFSLSGWSFDLWERVRVLGVALVEARAQSVTSLLLPIYFLR